MSASDYTLTLFDLTFNFDRIQVAKDVWTFSWYVYHYGFDWHLPRVLMILVISSPFARFGIIPLGGRSTAIKLSNGDVWVLASTPLTNGTKQKLNELGPVK